MRKACLVCGRPSDQARCPQHRQTSRPAATAGGGGGRRYRGTATWRQMRTRIWERDGGRCGRCGRLVVDGEPWDLGHLVPHAAGGPFEADNLQVEHVRCNRGA